MNIKLLLYSSQKSHKELIDSITDLRQRVEDERLRLASSLDW